jgi:hypothetical protein
MPCEYGPIAFGALSVDTRSSFIIHRYCGYIGPRLI